MNDGVAMLLERMKTNPEEFLTEGLHINSKWGSLIAEYSESLDPEDADVLKESLKKIKQQKFTELVMEELIDPKKSSLEDVINHYRVKGIASATTMPQQSSAGLYSNGIGGNATLLAQQQFQTEMMRSQLDLAKANKLETKKPHKTLFGKLFNYQ